MRNEGGLSVSAIDTQVDFGYIGVDPSYDGYDLPLDNASATAGSSQSGQGPEKALDGDTSTLWHSQWSAGHNRADHWFVIDYGKEYMMDGLRCLPRQTGGTNGIITEYKIEVSTDGVTYTEAATGEWDSSTSWKTADFEPVKARYMKLTVLDALSVESANDYASATEIRVTGTEAPTEPADKTELQVAYDLAAAMDLSIYTDESRQVMEEAIAAAAEVLANENALQAEIDEALNNLNAAKDQLELKAVDKSELEKMIALADEYAGKIGSYTPESAEAFQAAYDAAKTVFENAEASQEEVDNIVEVLQKAIDGLELAKEISTAVLEYALALAETADTEGVLDSVAEIFNNAKASAQNILERVQAGDASVTQEMVDESWQNLIKAMQYLSFKQGDKTDLQKVIDLANSLDLSQYLDEGQQAFNDALTAAEAVLADGNAMQDEADQAWKALLKAMSELRLKPSKDALEDLIASAEGLNTEGADEETVAVFRSALARAMSVLEDDQATEAEVASAEKELQSAIDQMLASTDGSTDGSGQSGTGNANSSGSQNSGANASKTSTSGSKAVKTGDSMFPIAGSAAAMAMAAAVIVLQRKKRS